MRERITELMVKKNINSFRQLAIAIDIPIGTVGKQMAGDRPISIETISAILNTFGDISAEWLMRGKGNMFIEEQDPVETSSEQLLTKLCAETVEGLEAFYDIVKAMLSLKKRNNQK